MFASMVKKFLSAFKYMQQVASHTCIISFPPGKLSPLFCRLLNLSKSTFLKNSFSNTIRVSKSLDPDQAQHSQAQHSVGPDLGPNCLQKLSADDTGRQS